LEIHIVSSGETVFSIALRYGVSAESIIGNNGLEWPYALPVGLALLILYPQSIHTVSEGDTLANIADRYEISVNELLRNNPPRILGDLLRVGQQLVIRYEQQKRRDLIVNAYAYPYIGEHLLMEVMPYLTSVIPFTYGFNAQGGIVPLEDAEILDAAKEYGVSATMHLSTLNPWGIFDSSAAVRVLTDSAVRQTLITNIVNVMTENGYTSLDVDFEYIPPEYTYAYYDFIRVLQQAVAAQEHTLIVALAPKVSGEQKGLLYEAHDYGLIGSAADYVFIMTYEWGHTYGPPMAVAPIPSVRRVLDYAVGVIPPQKILMGIPIYGYDWTLPHEPGVPARSLSPADAVSLAIRTGSEIQYDAEAHAPYFYYSDGTSDHIVWFEDVRSILEKMDLISEYSLAGVGFWHAGRKFSGSWSLLNALYNISE